MKILIVDDEPDQERMLHFSFKKKDTLKHLQIIYAGNGLEAINKLQQYNDIELALLDINMPEMDGLTLLQHICKQYPSLQAIIISAYGDMTNIRTAMNRGAFDFLIKPIDIDDLEKTLLKTFSFISELKANALRESENQVLKQQRTDWEMQALRAQMNPHFIFNCINSIDSFILNDDKANATLYLNKFAKLFRSILEGSRKANTTLSTEIQNLKLYIDLELLRSNFNFDVEYRIDPLLENSEIVVPSLILQPIVENAIQHGIRPLTDKKGQLTISISQDNTVVKYDILDNGIGPHAAMKLRKKSTEPVGLEITQARIQSFNQEEKASFSINQIMDHNHEPGGTHVTIYLKK